MPSTGLIILAAGESSRLGKPKQLLPYKEVNLLANAIKAALGSQCSPVVVVLGAYVGEILACREDFSLHQLARESPNLTITRNDRWGEGLSTSIRHGVETITKDNPDLDGIVLMTCDQPLVTSEIINELAHRFESSKSLAVASAYGGTIGIPAFFHHSLFAELLELKGDKGAKSILVKRQDSLSTIDFPEGAIDVDSEHDYAAVQAISHDGNCAPTKHESAKILSNTNSSINETGAET